MLTLRENEPLAPYTTFAIGGQAENFGVAKSEADLEELVAYASERNLTLTILGGGSNVLVSDAGVKGLVIKNEIKSISFLERDEKVLVTVGAGEVWDNFVSIAVTRQLWGVENLSHIPGTVGATPIQNVGAYGVEVGNVITAVRVFDPVTHKFHNFENQDCQFGYRDSFFKSPAGRSLIVTEVTYSLSEIPKPQLTYRDLENYFKTTPTLSDIRQAVITIRSKKFPDWTKVGTAGSFFKNPIIENKHWQELKSKYPELPGFPQSDGRVKVSLAWILDKVCQLRGWRESNVGTYEAQALVVINYGGAKASDIISLAKKIADKVFQTTKISIEWEVTEWK